MFDQGYEYFTHPEYDNIYRIADGPLYYWHGKSRQWLESAMNFDNPWHTFDRIENPFVEENHGQ